MEQRINIQEVFPEGYKGMYALVHALSKINITPIQKELMKIRASQINGCAFCLDMHTKDALKAGETPQRIFLLDAWRESGLFTEEEKVLLAMTEEITLIHQHGLSDATYNLAKQYFTEETIGQIIMSIVLINAWNRIAISTHLPIGA
ncbi:MAG: carboxymuconolactone decarboxylase family protein [Flavipsychrobacter sp.]